MLTAQMILDELRRLGVRLRIEGGMIVARPISAVPREIREAARTRKEDLLDIIARDSTSLQDRVTRTTASWSEHESTSALTRTLQNVEALSDGACSVVAQRIADLLVEFGAVIDAAFLNRDPVALRKALTDLERCARNAVGLR